MPRHLGSTALAAFAGLAAVAVAAPLLETGVEPAGAMDVPGALGVLEHPTLAGDSQHLWMTAPGAHAVVCLDLVSRRVSVTPTQDEAIALAVDGDEMFVLDGTRLCRIGDPLPLATLEDATDMCCDAHFHVLYASYRGGTVAQFDTRTRHRRPNLNGALGVAQSLLFDHDRLYVNDIERHTLRVFNVAERTLMATWPFPQDTLSPGMAVDWVHRRLFIASQQPTSLLSIDIDSGHVQEVVPGICPRAGGVVFVPEIQRVFVFGHDGEMSSVAVGGAVMSLTPGLQVTHSVGFGTWSPALHRLLVPCSGQDGQSPQVAVFDSTL